MKNTWMRVCCLFLMICMAAVWIPASAEGEYTIDNIRQYVAGLDEPVELADGTARPQINFDNAATTPALIPVMDEVNQKLMMYGSIGRGFSQKSNYSTELYEETRKTVLSFVGLDPFEDYDYTCFYVNNTTDGLNKLASALITDPEDLVLSTRMEHHANDLSWRERCRVIYAEVDEQGRVRYDEIERLLKENSVKLVAVTAASNVTGYVTDVHRIAKLAHQYGAMIVVDGAQIVAHRKFSMKGETPEENIDFFVFSAHKMYSPYGGGAVVGLRLVLNEHIPQFYGGGTVQIVGDDSVSFKDAPELYEAGSPNYPGVVGMGKAMEILKEVGFDGIQEHEQKLIRRMIDGLKQFDNVEIYGDTEDISDRVGVVTFNFSDINSYFLAVKLTELGGVATRRGAFCAHPYVWRLLGIPDDELDKYADCGASGTPGMIRVSFGIYNTEEEVDEFLKVLAEAIPAAKAYVAEQIEELGEETQAFDPSF
jgi:selenocysteine lyase/cysteine desulfurase